MSIDQNRVFAGFSLIELLTVIVLLGIMSVYAMGRFIDPDQFAARGFFNDTVIAVQFAQKLAISSGCDVEVTITISWYNRDQKASCTTINFLEATDIAVKNPANRSNAYKNSDIPGGFSLTPATIIFNARGTLGTGGDVTIMLTGGATPPSFKVYAQTGLVDVL